MTHYAHLCPNAPPGALESLEENYGFVKTSDKTIKIKVRARNEETGQYEEKEVEENRMLPINEEAGHIDCPYCGLAVNRMTPLSGREVKILSGQAVRPASMGVGPQA